MSWERADEFSRFIAIAAWSLMLVLQITYELRAEFPVVLEGVDVSASVLTGHLLAFFWITVGLFLSLMAKVYRRFSRFLVLASAALFVVIWLPWQSLMVVGPMDVLRFKWSLTNTSIDQLIFLMREIVVPLGFIFSMMCSALLILVRKPLV